MAHRKHRIRRLRLGVVVLSVMLLGGMLAWPIVLVVWEVFDQTFHVQTSSDLTRAERLRTHSLEVFAAVWFFWLGASVGSFLNVVVYRMPRGISMVWRPSSCPYCARPIKARDNIPVLGWLLLGGRCRTCRLPISSRYPIVELTTAALFLGLYFIELVSGGANLPLRETNLFRGAAEIVFDPQWDLLSLVAYHAWLLCGLLTWALIDYDRQPLPGTSVLLVLLVGAAAPAALPLLHPVPWQLPEPVWGAPYAWLAHIDSGLIGAAVGGLVGTLIGLSRGLMQPCRPASHAALGLAAVGLFLGWQAVVSVTLLAGMGSLAGVFLTRFPRAPFYRLAARIPWLGYLGLATCLQLAMWRFLDGIAPWPGHATPAWAIGVAVAVAVGLNLPGIRTATRVQPATPLQPPTPLQRGENPPPPDLHNPVSEGEHRSQDP